MTKSNITISIDTELVEMARIKDVNISGIINDYLKTYLMIKDTSNVVSLEGEIEQAKLKLEALNSKLEASKKALENSNILVIQKEKLNEAFNKVSNIIIESKVEKWRGYLKGYHKIITIQTGLSISDKELINEIEKRLKEKAPELI